MARPWAFLAECAATYGDAFTLQFPRFGTHVIVSHPDDVRAVFIADSTVVHAGRGNALLEPVLGKHSLLLADGERHLRQRALLQPLFRPDRIRAYADLIAEATRRWTALWEDDHVVQVQRTALEISKEVILRVALGLDPGEVARFSSLIQDLMRLVGTNATLEEAATPSRLQERFRQTRTALDEALQEHIDRRRSRSTGADDALAALLADRSDSSKELSDEEIRDQLVTLILAGHETTASSITWALFCLHEAPDALQALLDQIDGARPDDQSALIGLPLLQGACLETLRLRPVIPVVSRQLQGPMQLREELLPADVFVTPCAYLAHRRADAFPEPERFRPQRFLQQRFSPYVYFPFGGGARRCIGMSFALLEMQIVLGLLLRDFRFVPTGPVRPVRRAVTIVASGGGRMHVRRRNAPPRRATQREVTLAP
jgi:cytochrome P450